MSEKASDDLARDDDEEQEADGDFTSPDQVERPEKTFARITSEDDIEQAVESLFRGLFPDATYPEAGSSQADGHTEEDLDHEEPQPQEE